jgi:diaminopimelate epimerase
MNHDARVSLSFVKGHGSENDFVLLPDVDARLDLTEQQVRWLCDRRAGIGADGVIRVVRTADVPEVAGQAAEAEWFMDYRNADGSVAQMCGNGVRVLVTYLLAEGWVGPGSFAVATRAGARPVQVRTGAGRVEVAVDLGRWRLIHGPDAVTGGGDVMVLTPGLAGAVPGLSIDVGNPHVVVVLPSEQDLARLDLTRLPGVQPSPPEGANVEFVVLGQPGQLRMRVFERGVGETRSCGTGAAAAAMAARAWTVAAGGPETDQWRVHVPGGAVDVTALPGDRVELAGQAVLVARGSVDVPAADGPGITKDRR